MKIKKLKLTEAAESEAAEVINPQEDSLEQISDKLETDLELASGNEIDVSPAEAQELASEIKDAGEELNANTALVVPTEAAPLVIKNRLTRDLDKALKAAKYLGSEHISEVANVLVSGLPGSSKTASVYNWAKLNGVNICY